MNPNIPLFETIAQCADRLYRDCLDRAAEHKVAGRKHAHAREMEAARELLLFRRSAYRNLYRAKARAA